MLTATDVAAVFEEIAPRSLGLPDDELGFVFGNLSQVSTLEETPPQEKLSEAMQSYWTSFATNGDPNGQGLFHWPAYDPAVDDYLVLDETLAAQNGYRTSECDEWDALRVY